MSESHDKLPTVKVYEENAARLKGYTKAVEEKSGVKVSLVNAANAAITQGLPELEKKSGVERK